MVFLKKLIDFLLKTSYIVTSTNKFLLKLPSTILYQTPIYLQYYTKLPYIYNIIPNSHISTILYQTPIYLQYYTKLPYIYNIIPNSHISTILYQTPIYLQYYTKLPYIYNIIPNSHISTILYKILSSFSNSLISTILYKIFAKGHSRNITAKFALKFFKSFQFQFFSGHHGRDRVVANNYLCNQCLSPLTL